MPSQGKCDQVFHALSLNWFNVLISFKHLWDQNNVGKIFESNILCSKKWSLTTTTSKFENKWCLAPHSSTLPMSIT